MSSGKITQLLQSWVAGNTDSLDTLTPLVYEQLRRIAGKAFRGERSNHTLQATALVHEAFARLVDADVDWQDRSHFYALAARTMRRILVDHAQTKAAAKRGGAQRNLTLNEGVIVSPDVGDELLSLHEALNALQESDVRKAEILELHYFGGLTYEEMGNVLGLSNSTLDREMRFGKAWLRVWLENE